MTSLFDLQERKGSTGAVLGRRASGPAAELRLRLIVEPVMVSFVVVFLLAVPENVQSPRLVA